MSTYNVCDLVSSTVRKFIHSISAAKCTSPKSAFKKKISMKTLKLDFNRCARNKQFSTRTEELSTVECLCPVSVKQQFLTVF
jgi:hypothetical protein